MSEKPKQKLCSKCDVVIPKARLEVLPDTQFCVKCAEVMEKDLKQLPFDDSYNSDDCLDILSGDG